MSAGPVDDIAEAGVNGIILTALVGAITAGLGALIGAALAWAIRRVRRTEAFPAWPVALFVIFGVAASRPATHAAERYLDVAMSPTKIDQMFEEIEETRPSFAVLRRDHPKFYGALTDSLAEELRDGASDDELGLSIQRQVGSLYKTLLVSADDELIVDYVVLMVDTAKALRDASPQTCVDFYFGAGANIAPFMTRELVAREAELVDGTLSREPAENPRTAGVSDFQSALMLAFEDAAERRHLSTAALVGRFSGHGSRTSQCDAFIGVYESIAAMPRAEMVPVVRRLLMSM